MKLTLSDISVRVDPSTPLPDFEATFANLLEDVYEKIIETDKKERLTKSYTRRHRLAVTLEVVRTWLSNSPRTLPIVPLAALAELLATVQVFALWKSDPAWPKWRRGLVNPSEYVHSVVLLSFASHLRSVGLHAIVQPERVDARSPDLHLVIDDTSIASIELKVPAALLWQTEPLTPPGAKKHIRKLFGAAGTGAQGQLAPPRTGILIIGGLSFEERTRAMLKAAGERHFLFPPGDYSHILGIFYVWIGARMNVRVPDVTPGRFIVPGRLDSVAHVDLLKNPGYSGPINFNMVDSVDQ